MNHKIKTDIGYCVVSDDCALDEEELKTLAADIKKQPKLTQPNFFIDMRYDYKFIQLQALLKITELLQPVIQSNIKNKTSGIANMDCVSVYQERNEVEIVLPPRLFRRIATLLRRITGRFDCHAYYPSRLPQMVTSVP